MVCVSARPAFVVLGTLLAISPACAETPRDMLVRASFGEMNKAAAIGRVSAAQTIAAGILRRAPGDREATIIQATALGYRAKLTGSRSEAIAARKRFEALVAQDPRDPERQLALGAWHASAIYKLGGLMGRAAVGAQKSVGLAALDRAVALSANRAMTSGLAALLRLELDPQDARGRALAEAASRAPTPTPLDLVMQRAANAILVPIRAGNRDATRRLASRLLPFGRLDE